MTQKTKSEILTEIRRIGDSYKLLAEDAAVDAIRYPRNKSKQDEAKRYVIIHDATQRTTNQIADLIIANWPSTSCSIGKFEGKQDDKGFGL